MDQDDLVSVIIPSYNRFEYLQNAINSVLNQTYKNFEIIVINDGSTQEEYYTKPLQEKVSVINLEQNQKNVIGYVSDGFIRNFGIDVANGKYLAFLDDDDMWMPEKLDIQIREMKKYNFKFSSTEGYYGEGSFNKNINYELYNSEKFYNVIKKKYSHTNFSPGLLERLKGDKFEYPNVWSHDFLKIHNCVIVSSVIVEKSLLDTLGGFRGIPTSKHSDYDCWLGLLKISNLLYVNEPLFYYDGKHGSGQNWN